MADEQSSTPRPGPGPSSGSEARPGPASGTEPAARREPASRLVRVTEGRVLKGVCTGLGRYTGIDPVVFRVGFAIMVLAHGQGILLYVLAALLMPAAPDRPAELEQLFRRRFDAAGTLSVLGALLGASMVFSLTGNGLLHAGVPTDTIAVMTVAALALLTAHARGVDLGSAARSLPERLHGYPLEPRRSGAPGPYDVAGAAGAAAGRPGAPGGAASAVSLEKGTVSLEKDTGRGGGGLPEGMIDLAKLGTPGTADDAAGGGEVAPDRPRPPHRPHRPAEPARPAGQPHACKGRTQPMLTTVTLLAAMAAAAAVWPVAQDYPGPRWAMLVTASALAVVGCGLLLGGWYKARGLTTMGTVLTCALLTTSAVAEAPADTRYGEVEWRPTDAARIGREYRLGAGVGRLDLTGLSLRPGQRVQVTTTITVGQLAVRVPRSARVEVDVRVALGDLDLAGRTITGPAVRADQVLEADGDAADPPVIALRVRGRLSDVTVTRV